MHPSTPTPSRLPPGPLGPGAFAARVLIAVGIVALALLAWRLAGVFLLVFGALIAATLLRSVGRLLERHARLPGSWSAAVALLLVLAALGLTGWLVGDRLAQQFSTLRDTLPAAVAAATRWLDGHALGAQVLDGWERLADRGMPWARIAGIAGTTANALGNLLLIVLLGVYLSFNPALYRRGLLRLVPLPQRPQASAALDAAAQALGRWLMGQGLSMAFVGAATGIGVWLLGLPMALPLGIIAALLDFVPLIGPIAAGIVVVVFAFLAGPEQALYAALLCLAIQQVESYLLMPLLQRWAVSLPPVLGLVAVVVFGLLFGVMGVVFATPLIVVLMVLVQKLYVEGVIERGTPGAD
jgi:predicted PurR-regulated permease PerM